MDEGKRAQHSNIASFKKKVQDQRLAGRVRTGRRKTLFGRKKTPFGRPNFFSDIQISKKGAGRFRTQCFRRFCPHPVPTPPVKLPATEAACRVSLTPVNIWGRSLKRHPSTSHPMQAAGTALCTALWWECLQIPAGSPNLIFTFSHIELVDKI